ncbi:MAG: hypothetical protein JO372_19680, partial [Solirubrobacterales bacterium]|nr:hypothetical protein [Solirubrobacterales bacterium]
MGVERAGYVCSLRRGSHNTTLMRAAAQLPPPTARLTGFDIVASLAISPPLRRASAWLGVIRQRRFRAADRP